VSFAAEEIASQPECWVLAARRAAEAVREFPTAGERVAVVGCGTSWHMASAYAALREASGAGETDAVAASEVAGTRRYDRAVFISRSGSTTEVLDAIDRFPPGTRTLAITADAATPIVDAVDAAIVLDFADERSVVQTRFATSALVLLRAHLGQDVRPLARDAARALVEPLPEGALGRSHFTFLGHGWTVGLAHEAALKLREAARAWTESYPGMEFRHGPISATDANTLVWSFGSAPSGLEDDLVPTGAVLVASELDPLADLIRAQRFAVELATLRNLDPDNPRHLGRSVILGP
jgi:fructoselysine-6-P-deglycase FrlB-like protein